MKKHNREIYEKYIISESEKERLLEKELEMAQTKIYNESFISSKLRNFFRGNKYFSTLKCELKGFAFGKIEDQYVQEKTYTLHYLLNDFKNNKTKDTLVFVKYKNLIYLVYNEYGVFYHTFNVVENKYKEEEYLDPYTYTIKTNTLDTEYECLEVDFTNMPADIKKLCNRDELLKKRHYRRKYVVKLQNTLSQCIKILSNVTKLNYFDSLDAEFFDTIDEKQKEWFYDQIERFFREGNNELNRMLELVKFIALKLKNKLQDNISERDAEHLLCYTESLIYGYKDCFEKLFNTNEYHTSMILDRLESDYSYLELCIIRINEFNNFVTDTIEVVKGENYLIESFQSNSLNICQLARSCEGLMKNDIINHLYKQYGFFNEKYENEKKSEPWCSFFVECVWRSAMPRFNKELKYFFDAMTSTQLYKHLMDNDWDYTCSWNEWQYSDLVPGSIWIVDYISKSNKLGVDDVFIPRHSSIILDKKQQINYSIKPCMFDNTENTKVVIYDIDKNWLANRNWVIIHPFKK